MNDEPPASTDLILSAALGYGAQDLEVFLRSAAANVPQADVLLVTEKRGEEFLETIRRFNPRVRVWRPPDARLRRRAWRTAKRGRRLRHPSPGEGLKAMLLLHSPWPRRALAVLHISVVRHFWFRQIFREGLDGGAQRVLLADCRDVYFQDDPFPLTGKEVLVGEEHRWITAESYVAKYVKRVYGSGAEGPMLGRAVLCAGVLLGTRAAIVGLEEEWTREFRRKARAVHGRFVDQILLNKILYVNGRVAFRALPEGGALLTHLIYTPKELHELGPDGVRTAGGERVRIVHRYDRHAEMKAYAEAMYRRPDGAPREASPVSGQGS